VFRRDRARTGRVLSPTARLARTAALAALATLPVPPGDADAWSARTNYALHCQGCHLADGSETPGLVPKLRGTVGRLAATAAGRDYLVRLPNVAGVPLDDQDLAALLDWLVLAFGDTGARVAPFRAEEIAARRQPLVDVEAARRAVLGADDDLIHP